MRYYSYQYRASFLALFCLPFALCLTAFAHSRLGEKGETPGAKQAKVYRAQFEKAGRKGLDELAKDADLSLALQAAWESSKHLQIAPCDQVGVYTEAGTKQFLKHLKDRTKAPTPTWWSDEFLSLEVTKNDFHRVSQRAKSPPRKEIEIGVRKWLVGKDVALSQEGDDLLFKSAELSFQYPHSAFTAGSDALADAVGEKCTCLAAYRTLGGFAFKVAGFENKGGKRLWIADVWALDRQDLLGPSARHRAELVVSGDAVFVFGSEAAGLYVESFNVETGKCNFRFCSNYWFNWSEKWIIK